MFHIFQLSFLTILYNITCEMWRTVDDCGLSTCSLIFVRWCAIWVTMAHLYLCNNFAYYEIVCSLMIQSCEFEMSRCEGYF